MEAGAHSADTDHTIMTGGTFSPKKVATSESGDPLYLHHYLLPIGPLTDSKATYRGWHSFEHGIAFTKGTGQLKAFLAEEADDPSVESRLLDVSPFMNDPRGTEPTMAFRATLVSTDGKGLPKQVVAAAYLASLRQMRAYYEDGNEPPFSTPEACGDYQLHSAQEALELINTVLEQGNDLVITGGGARRTEALGLSVCDLRLVRPRSLGASEQRLLDGRAAHILSQRIENTAWRRLPTSNPNTLRVGTYGCLTGAYVMFAYPEGQTAPDESTYVAAHTAIAQSLASAALRPGTDGFAPQVASDAALCIGFIEQISPDICQAVTGRS